MAHRYLKCVVSLFVCYSISAQASNEGASEPAPIAFNFEQLITLSLEELLKIKVATPSAYNKIEPARNPASITTITAEDIRLTPARNISDLMEIYVPGAFYMTHDEGAHMGIRGIISDRNVKFLLLVNGRNLNQKGHNGVRTEIDHWDMGDIQRIEIIRGPGSVVNGPGAIGGVINIITHTAKSSSGTRLALQHHQQYDSSGVSFSHTGQRGGADYYVYASALGTQGTAHTSFSSHGYLTEDINLGDTLATHYADYDDKPQIKLHTDIQFNEKLNVWARYTQSGRVKPIRQIQVLYDQGLQNSRQDFARQLTFQLEHKNNIEPSLSLTTIVSVDSLDIEDQAQLINSDFYSKQNLRANFSEDEFYIKAIFNWDYSKELDLAFGADYSWDHLGPGWGDSDNELILGDLRNIINSEQSIHLNTVGGSLDPALAVYAGDGFSSQMLSVFGEASIQPNEINSWLLSARTDYHSIGGTAFSPRIAYSRQLEGKQIFKAILQRSVRFNTLEQLWIQDNQLNSNDNPEEINNLELILTDYQFENQVLNYIAYISDAQFLGWSLDDHQTTNVGNGQFVGLEFEYNLKWDTGKLGFNYSVLELIDFHIDSSQETNGISYSDYNRLKDGFLLDGSGNSLNNWFNQGAKIWVQYQPKPQWILHLDAHLLWAFDGPPDGINDTIEATQGDPAQQDSIERADDIFATNAYDYDFRLNASLTYQLNDNTRLGVYGHNILGAHGNKRYHYDTGSSGPLFSRTRFIEEPRHISFRVSSKF